MATKQAEKSKKGSQISEKKHKKKGNGYQTRQKGKKGSQNSEKKQKKKENGYQTSRKKQKR